MEVFTAQILAADMEKLQAKWDEITARQLMEDEYEDFREEHGFEARQIEFDEVVGRCWIHLEAAGFVVCRDLCCPESVYFANEE